MLKSMRGEIGVEIESIKQRDLTEYLKTEGVELKPTGKETWVGLCPLHEDTNPSLHVSKKDTVWLWHCFGCNQGGTIIDYKIIKDGISVKDAIEQLGGNYTLAPNQIKRPKPSINPNVRKKLLQRVVEHYHEKTFNEDKRGREYLQTRGITNPSIYQRHQIGYSNGTLYKVLPREGEQIEQLKEIGILKNNGEEFFKDAVVFPILDEQGNVVSLYGRKINQVQHLYLKGPHQGLFNGVSLKSYPEIILVESIIDAISLEQIGIKNVIPLYGTNGLTQDHIEAFKKNNIQKIILLMDGDSAGEKAAHSLKEKLNFTEIQIAKLPEGEDPNSYIKNHTKEEIEKILYSERTETKAQIKKETKLLEDGFTINYAKRQYEIRGVEKHRRSLKANIKAVHNRRFHIDTIDFYNSKSRTSLVRGISLFYSIDSEIIERDIESIIIESENYILNKQTQVQTTKELTNEEKTKALKLAKDPSLMKRIENDLEKIGLVGETKNKILLYLSMSSRKMLSPLSVLILSGSGAGKSTLQDKVLSMCPEEDLIKLTSLTKQALFYKDTLSMQHKVLSIEEDKGAEEASYAIRNLISSKRIMIESTIRDPFTGKMTTMTNEVLGPTAVQKSTTSPKQDAETKSRFIIISLDETTEQTAKIIEGQRYGETIEGILKQKNKKSIEVAHQNFQRILQPLEVVIPDNLETKYQINALMARRHHPKYLSIIKAVTFIHQFQREIKEIVHEDEIIKYIEATESDLKIAQQISKQLLDQEINELSEPGRTLLEHMKEQQQNKLAQGKKPYFTRREIREKLQWTDYQTKIYLKELVELEYIGVVSGRNGSVYRYQINEPGEAGETW